MDEQLLGSRVTDLNTRPVDESGGCIIYWMQKSQRAVDNPALEFAVRRANELGKLVLAYLGLYDQYPMASPRAFKFMLEGLKETAEHLDDRGIGFLMRREAPFEGIVAAAVEFKACAVVVDDDYLNTGRSWRERAADALEVRLCQVDADTVVPARSIGKEEWGAYTIRPKITAQLKTCLREFDETKVRQKWRSIPGDAVNTAKLEPAEFADSLKTDQDGPGVEHFTGGFSEARKRLDGFLEHRIHRYADDRNDIGDDVSSELSPYLHFGQISALTVGLAVEKADAPAACIEAFMEQLIVRRELAINFCLYNHAYDSLQAAPEWAQKTLDAHKFDERAAVYSLEEFEGAETHDGLWNRAQTELVKFGKIHPYLRMVWAKKILEWSPSAADALRTAIYLNDKYALDGRDPNGFTNIAWCIYGKHDRPFPERPIFGKIRYMSTESTKRKTNWKAYMSRIGAL